MRSTLARFRPAETRLSRLDRRGTTYRLRGFLLEHGVPVRQGHAFYDSSCHRF